MLSRLAAAVCSLLHFPLLFLSLSLSSLNINCCDTDQGDGLAVQQQDLDDLLTRRERRSIWEIKRPSDVTLYDLLYENELGRYGRLAAAAAATIGRIG